MKGNSSPGFLIFIHELFRQKSGSVQNVIAHVWHGPEQSPGEAELRDGRKCLLFDPTSASPGHGYLSIYGKELPSAVCPHPFSVFRTVCDA